jgi:hypothetical protein
MQEFLVAHQAKLELILDHILKLSPHFLGLWHVPLKSGTVDFPTLLQDSRLPI